MSGAVTCDWDHGGVRALPSPEPDDPYALMQQANAAIRKLLREVDRRPLTDEERVEYRRLLEVYLDARSATKQCRGREGDDEPARAA